ncbi:hypothetical protein QYF61_015309 [Mycteria americana]|uniref:Uncharacterized protein n=1 Tax=Mycteria americana TaxID=33587 RepID=A0AAN7MQB5_MYCAM|nr:hypothetical protein QYF61_015309 [Mycteria americana]
MAINDIHFLQAESVLPVTVTGLKRNFPLPNKNMRRRKKEDQKLWKFCKKPTLHAEHDAIWSGIALGSVGVSCPSRVPSQLLVSPSPLAVHQQVDLGKRVSGKSSVILRSVEMIQKAVFENCQMLSTLQRILKMNALTLTMAIRYIQISRAPRGWRLHHFPGHPVPMLDNPFSEVKFPNIQSKPPLAQLEAISSRPITCYLGEETDPHLTTASFQAKQPQFPQPLLIRLLL